MSYADLLAQADRQVLRFLGEAEPVVIRTALDEEIAVLGVFRAEYQVADTDRPGLSTSIPAVFLRLSDLVTAGGRAVDPEQEPRKSLTVTVNGTAYTVYEVQKDGQGAVVLQLHEAG